MTRMRAVSIGAAFVLAFALAPARAADSTIPDDTYGAGGTKFSRSNDKQELVAEVWRDKNGLVREQFEQDADGSQFWGFFVGEGTASYSWGGAIAIRPIGGPAGRFQMTIYGTGDVTIKEYGFLTRAELDTEFAHWHDQMRGWINGFIRAGQGNG